VEHLAVYGLGFLELDHVGGHDFAGHDMDVRIAVS
jgi:hypothetical protein